MHLAEGVLPGSHALGWSAAAPVVIWSIRGEQRARRDTPSSSVITGLSPGEYRRRRFRASGQSAMQ